MWRVARSLDKLLAEVNASAPRRSKVADGSIGDAAHATRASDHNPFIVVKGVGVVRARDFTHDPDGGFDAHRFAEHVRQLGAKGFGPLQGGGYVISNGRIAGGSYGWSWRRYSGSNPHDHHVHVSVSLGRKRFDSRKSWGVKPSWVRRVAKTVKRVVKRRPAKHRIESLNRAVKPGHEGRQVVVLQRVLNVCGFGRGLKVDGVYGRATESAVARFHKRNPRFKSVRRGRDTRIGNAGFKALQRAARR